MYKNIFRTFVLSQVFLLASVFSFSQSGGLSKGSSVPNFNVTSIDDGKTYTPESLKGKVYLVDFWATWCAPCIKALPHLQKVYDQYKGQGFTIISLSMDQSPEAVTAFRKKKFPMPWFNGFVKGGLESNIAQSFKISGLPGAYLVDKNGKIIAKNKELENDKLDKLLAAHIGK
ncbi:MAG TPA: TlpA disulfide reductase family protein [Segetibacter sp.]|jgi:thiol-disulfide isomerase/thioredoxin